MPRAAVLVSFVLASLAPVAVVRSAEAALLHAPPGVSARAWMPITGDLGFVIELSAPERNSTATPPADGYFVVRRHSGWLRLDPVPQVARLRWPLRSRAEKRWIPIADHFGFMVEAPAGERGEEQGSSVFGYFLASRVDHGTRLDPIAHGALFGGPLTANPLGTSVPVTARLRFVIQQSTSSSGVERLPSAVGYFIVNADGHWLRLNPIGAGQLLRQPL
jgi:hypothetical protein